MARCLRCSQLSVVVTSQASAVDNQCTSCLSVKNSLHGSLPMLGCTRYSYVEVWFSPCIMSSLKETRFSQCWVSHGLAMDSHMFCLPAINTQPNVLQRLTGQLLMVQVLCEGQLKSQVLTKWCTLAYCYYGNSFSNPPTPNCIKVYSPLQSQFRVSVSWFPSVAWVFPKLFHSVSQNVGPSGVGKCDVGFKWAERQAWLN